MEKKEILKGIENKGIYDFISNEGHKLKKEQLISILKEVDFELYNFCDNYLTYKNRVKNVLKELDNTLY